ncbi:MAG: hemerythrin domain-containing protein [Treponema sp.]|jgi:hemerythrin|nr:hemerythrin domain-containing protein [Treponema sp.]
MEYNVIQLDNYYSVGIESIDEQHKQLISMCNNLYLNSCKRDEISKNFFNQSISSLADFLKYHLFVEEQLLSRVAFPEFHSHKEEHSKAVEFINRYLAYLGTDEESQLKKEIPVIREYILKHITVSDRKYANYIHTMNRYTPWHMKDSYLPTEIFLG